MFLFVCLSEFCVRCELYVRYGTVVVASVHELRFNLEFLLDRITKYFNFLSSHFI